MKAALRDSYVEFVVFTGVTEKYPSWFELLLMERTYTDESRFTFWVDREDRRPDYYEKKLIEEYSVILKKSDGDIHVTDYDVFQNLYITFTYDAFTNSGIAAYEDDCIEYVECNPGLLGEGYPYWFYEYFTEAVTLPSEFNGFMLFAENDEVEVTERCVVLRNKSNEIRSITYNNFIKHYDDKPSILLDVFLRYNVDNNDEYGGW